MQRRILRQLCQRRAHDARSGDADIEHHVRLTDAMKRACHERIVFRRIAKYHQLGSADALAVLGQFCGFAHDLAHHGDGVHIDACLGGADVDGGADEVRLCERARDGFNQRAVSGAEAFLYQRTVAADKVDTDVLGGAVKRFGVFDRIAAADGGQHSDRRDADALVDDRNTVFLLDLFAGRDQILCFCVNLVVDLFAGAVDVAVCAVE